MESTKLSYMQKYYQLNKKKILENRQKNYDAGKEVYNEKFLCSCGGKFTWKNKSIHFKSKKHEKYVKIHNPFGIGEGEQLVYLSTKKCSKKMEPIVLDL